MLESRIMRDGPDGPFLGLEFEWDCRPQCSTNIDRNRVDELQAVAFINGPRLRVADPLLNLRPASDKSFKWMKQQLQDCRENHKDCRDLHDLRRQLKMPCRLIEVGPLEASTLYLRDAELPGMDTYAIGSYTWGSKMSTAISDSKLKTRNLRSRMKKGMRFSEMPRTIQDLVTVTRQLGLNYLWIDALCIVQDDQDEIGRELKDMPQFYKRSDVMISAARAKHGDEGFLQPRDAAQAYGAVYKLSYQQTLPDGITNASVILCENELRNQDEPINTRIWTDQEHKAPLRILSFGSRQTSWSCRRCWAVDGGSSSREEQEPEFTQPRYDGSEPAQVSVSRMELEQAMQGWMDAVCAYSNREGDPSRKSDRLHAFAQTTEMFSERVGWPTTQYCWGIWDREVIRLLLWSKESPQIGDRYGPSWSWLSLPGPVKYPNSTHFCRVGDSRDYNLDIIHFPKAQQQDLCLRVRGFILEMPWDGNMTTYVRIGELLSINITWDFNVTVRSVWLLEVISEHHTTCSHGLVLKKKHNAEFERCGYYKLELMELYQCCRDAQQLWNKSRERLWTDKAEILIA